MSDGFTTTREGQTVSLATALLTGLAPDGSLYVPAELPALPWPPPSSVPSGGTDLRAVARWAAPALFPSVPTDILDRVVEDALDFPVPLVEVEAGIWVMELFHGPTHAFKDVAARFMAHLMSELDEASGRQGDRAGSRTVLVATSGDTGGAVASAFHGRPGYRVVTLFPRAGISERQRRQMTTLGDNVRAVAVEGTFDDCQRLVKEAFGDAGLRGRHGLMSANSINVGRLLPQTLYYLHAAHRLQSARGHTAQGLDAGHGRGVGKTVSAPHFVVPAGNLGNLCAGLMAHRMGMPASGFTGATNENSAFVDYLNGQPFRPRQSVPTSSSAMDVGNPSNLERIVWLYGGDDETVRRAVDGVSVHQEEVSRRIADLHRRVGYVADPHTAVAYEAAVRQNERTDAPLVVLGTAHPAKFPQAVEAAIGREIDLPPGLRAVRDREEQMTVIQAELSSLADLLGAADLLDAAGS